MIKKITIGILVIITVGILYLCFAPVSIDPAAFTPPPNPGLEGRYAPNLKLQAGQKMLTNLGIGPEDIAMGKDGLLYTGLADGRIVLFDTNGKFVRELCHTGGRPLGMQFDSHGQLIVADEYKGLLSIDSNGIIQSLATEVNGSTIFFADDLDIAMDGTIYFTDASQRNHDITKEVWEMQPTGRLISHSPSTGTTQIIKDSLLFANGVAIHPSQEYLYVNETLGMRIWKIWIKGPNKGKSEIFIDALPGFPDNISTGSNGTFWVALNSVRNIPEFEALMPRPFLRKILARLGVMDREAPDSDYGMILGINEYAIVTHNLQDSTGEFHHFTSVNEYDSVLYLGSQIMPHVIKLKLDQTLNQTSYR